MAGGGCTETSNAAAQEAADAPARRGGGVKGQSAAAGLAGGGGGVGGGREPSAPCARVEKRRDQCGGRRHCHPLRRRRAASTLAASVTRSAPCPSLEGRLVGLSGPSLGRRELRAATTTALISVITTASAGRENERVRKGSRAGPCRRGRGLAREGRDWVKIQGRKISRLLCSQRGRRLGSGSWRAEGPTEARPGEPKVTGQEGECVLSGD